jgi:hypothetical protein
LEVFKYSILAQQIGSLLIAVLALLYFRKRAMPILILGFYGLNSILFEIMWKIHSSNIIGDIYTLTEALILLYFFYILFNSSKAKTFIVVLITGYCVFYLIFMFGNWQKIHSDIRMLRDLVMIACSLLYFYSLMTNMPTTEITRYPMFWIVAAFIFFFAGTFVLSLSLDYLVTVLKDNLLSLWTARNFFRFFFCLVVCYGLWLDLRLVMMKQRVQP